METVKPSLPGTSMQFVHIIYINMRSKTTRTTQQLKFELTMSVHVFLKHIATVISILLPGKRSIKKSSIAFHHLLWQSCSILKEQSPLKQC